MLLDNGRRYRGQEWPSLTGREDIPVALMIDEYSLFGVEKFGWSC